MRRIYDAEFAGTGTAHQHLSRFWWVDTLGLVKGVWTRRQAYDYVRAHQGGEVYVQEGTARVAVGHRTNGTTNWVHTYADGVWKDNLTALATRHAHGLVNN